MITADFLKSFLSADEETKKLVERLASMDQGEEKRALPVLKAWNNGTEHNAEKLRQRLQEINII